MYVLYVIPGSHACRSAMLMLDHKGVPYRRVDLLTFAHPILARIHGFNAGDQVRSAGGRRSLAIRVADQLATVPALAGGKERISTNHGIARFLDDRHPEPRLLPSEVVHRARVEEAELWANDTLQMDCRRILGAAMLKSPGAFCASIGEGRMGYLLYRHALVRRVLLPTLLNRAFAITPDAERELLDALPSTLDRVDGLIADGVIGGERLNVADFMIAPCLALLQYRPDVRPLFEGRASLELVDRLLPEPLGGPV